MQLNEYIQPAILAFCAAAGYVIKNALDFIPNKFIPLIGAALGIAASCAAHNGASFDIVLVGMVSGLASTGLYELVRSFISPQRNAAKECNRDSAEKLSALNTLEDNAAHAVAGGGQGGAEGGEYEQNKHK